MALNFHAIGKTNQYVVRRYLSFMIHDHSKNECTTFDASMWQLLCHDAILTENYSMATDAQFNFLKTFNDYRTPIPFITRDSLISIWWAQTKRMIHMNFCRLKKCAKRKMMLFSLEFTITAKWHQIHSRRRRIWWRFESHSINRTSIRKAIVCNLPFRWKLWKMTEQSKD